MRHQLAIPESYYGFVFRSVDVWIHWNGLGSTTDLEINNKFKWCVLFLSLSLSAARSLWMFLSSIYSIPIAGFDSLTMLWIDDPPFNHQCISTHTCKDRATFPQLKIAKVHHMIYLIYTELPKLSVFSSPLCPGQLMVVDGLRKLKQGRGLWRVRVNTLKRACIPWHVFRVVGPSFSLQDLLWLKFGGHMWSKTKNTHVYIDLHGINDNDGYIQRLIKQ